MSSSPAAVDCCIAGGGPAGIMLGFLLARAGIEVAVFEKWPDFFRDFRGDTIHPSTMELMRELGLLEEFLQLPHNETRIIEAQIGQHAVKLADFSQLKVATPFIAFMPQWDFLSFLTKQAQNYPNFHLLMGTSVTDLVYDNEVVVGVKYASDHSEGEMKAKVVVGADGRHSTVREKSQLKVKNVGSPMDVLWFHISRKASDPNLTLGHYDDGHFMVMIDRDTYWQCGFIIPKGHFEQLQQEGLPSLLQSITTLEPFLADRIEEIKSWEDIKLLQVTVDCLPQWYRSGLICIGDAAHAMSPIGGVGINLAVQDAVAAANFLIPAFKQGKVTNETLQAIQKRRMLPTRLTQRLQVLIQNRLIGKALVSHGHPQLPYILRLWQKYPFLRRIPARIIGIGFRPEHIQE